MRRLMMILLASAGLCVAMSAVSAQDAPKPDAEKKEAPKAGEPKPKGEAPKPAAPKAFTIDFRYEGLMFCDVKINGAAQTWNFLIDSGASTSVLSTRTADKLEIEGQDAGQAQGVGEQDLQIASGVTFEVGGFSYTGMVGIIDLTKIADSMGKYMDGILGADWLMKFETIEFDYLTSKATFKPFADGEGPRGLADALGGLGGGAGGVPGLPGLPGGRGRGGEEKKDEKKEEKKDGAEDFNIGPRNFSAFVPPDLSRYLRAQTALVSEDSKKTEVRKKLKAFDIPFRQTTVSIPFGNLGELTLVPLWMIDMEINGKKHEMMFDTGAMPLLTLTTQAGEAHEIGHSYEIAIEGVGTASATMGLVDSFKVGHHEETGPLAASSMDLKDKLSIAAQFEKALGAIPGGGGMIMGLLRMLGLRFPEPDGIIGLPICTRYRKFIVNHDTMMLRFEPYETEDADKRKIDPTEEDPMVVKSVHNAWTGKAGELGVNGKPLKFDQRKEAGIEGGLVLSEIKEGSSAAKAGLVAGDTIYELVNTDAKSKELKEGEKDAAPVRSMTSVVVLAAAAGAGAEWTLRVKKKDGAKTTVTLKLDTYQGEVDVPERYRKELGLLGDASSEGGK